jgi:hypothetical protein
MYLLILSIRTLGDMVESEYDLLEAAAFGHKLRLSLIE